MKSVGFKFEEAKELLSDDNSYLYLITKSRTIILSPRFIGKILSGIREYIDREVNLFSDFLGGVIVAYSNIKLHQPLSSVHDDTPYLHLHIQADYIVFKPYVGCTLKGVVNKLSQDHIGCLIHKHFNASVPRPFKNYEKSGKNDHLQQGDEIKFRVTGLSSSNKILFIKGALREENNVPKEDNITDSKGEILAVQEESANVESSSKSKKKKKTKKSKDRDDSFQNVPENQEMVQSLDSNKRKRSHDTDVDSGIVDSDTDIRESESKRLKSDSLDDSLDVVDTTNRDNLESAQDNVTDMSMTLDETVLSEYIGSTKKHKKKKKHKHKDRE